MSHLVTIQTKIRDPIAISSTCHRLNLKAPVMGTAQLFDGEATGVIVELPNWNYPLVIDTTTGDLRFDNYEGAWGNPLCLDLFLQTYAVEKAKLEATKNGYHVHESLLQDGSIKLQITHFS